MTPRLSKFVLTSHIIFSVGWCGAVAVFVALAITGVNTQNIQLARSAYLAMELSGWYIIVPFCLGSLITGVVQSLGSRWGLFKHYWIVVKLIVTIVVTILLLLHMQPVSYLAGLAAEPSFASNEQYGLRMQVIAESGAALLVLLGATTISVYKPWGKIQYGSRDNQGRFIEIRDKSGNTKKSRRLIALIVFISLIILIIIKHLVSGGMRHH